MNDNEEDFTETMQEIIDILSTLKNIRKTTGGWLDTESALIDAEKPTCEQQFLQYLEAIECFIEYYDILELEKKQPKLSSKILIDDHILTEDVNKVLRTIEKHGYPATPTLKLAEGEYLEKGVTDFTDSVCLTLNMLVDLKVYMEKTKKKLKIKPIAGTADIDETIDKIANDIMSLSQEVKYKKKVIGWCVPAGPKIRDVNIYFTHQAILALQNFYGNLTTDDKGFRTKIETHMERMRSWIESLAVDEGKNGWLPGSISDVTYKEEKHFINSVYGALSLLMIKDVTGNLNEKIVKNTIEYIIDKWETKKELFSLKKNYIVLGDPTHYKENYTDSSTLPSSIILLSEMYKRALMNRDVLGKVIGEQIKELQNSIGPPIGKIFEDYKLDRGGLLAAGEITQTYWTLEALSEYCAYIEEKVKPTDSEEKHAVELYKALKETFQLQNLFERVSNIEGHLKKIGEELKDIKNNKGGIDMALIDAKIERAIRIIRDEMEEMTGQKVAMKKLGR